MLNDAIEYGENTFDYKSNERYEARELLELYQIKQS